MDCFSVFTGIAGIDYGLQQAGVRIVGQCEIDPYCLQILERHYPDVPRWKDIREVTSQHGRSGPGEMVGEPASTHANGTRAALRGPGTPVDILAGGSPCQDLSAAGKQAGLTGQRSSLFFEFARVAGEFVRPGGWLLFENVPGLFACCSCDGCRECGRVLQDHRRGREDAQEARTGSRVGVSRCPCRWCREAQRLRTAHRGTDFWVVCSTLRNLGFHDLAYRVLDSRYFGVPQRRRRIYIVGRRAVGDGARAVLLEPESGGGDFAPSEGKGSRVASSLVSGSHGPGISPPGRYGSDDLNIVGPLQGGDGGRGHRIGADEIAAGQLVTGAIVSRYGKGTDSDATDQFIVSGTVRSHMRPGSASETLAITGPLGGGDGGAGRRSQDDPNLVLAPENDTPVDTDGVREAPGAPGWLDTPPDGPRYSAIGNSVTTTVPQWIGERILAWEAANS